jgi:hypothetical protein
MDWAAAGMIGFLLGILFERLGCNTCKHVIGSTAHGEALDRAYDAALGNPDTFYLEDARLLDEVRVYVNRRGMGL